MTTLCFVPIVPYVPKVRLGDFFGYDMRMQNAELGQFIFLTSLEEYNRQLDSVIGGVRGMLYENDLHIPPFALYPDLHQAKRSLGIFGGVTVHEGRFR